MRTEIAYALILALMIAGIFGVAVWRANWLEQRAVRRGRNRSEARRRYRWWSRG